MVVFFSIRLNVFNAYITSNIDLGVKAHIQKHYIVYI